jgi:hypothetical protein
MKDYIRRSTKFIVYILVIFILILGVIPMIGQGKPMTDSLRELLQNSRFSVMFGLLMVYGLLYPLISFVSIKRHLNGSFAQDREKFEKAFAALDYILTEDSPDKLVFRKKSQLSRLLQWYEDEITIYPRENPVIISGFRRWVIRIDRLIDQYLIKENQS